MTRGPWHVAVLMGGWSAERPVSLSSGEGVAKALESRGHKVTRIDMDRDVARRLADAQADVVFNALHGVPGEDGTIQGMMDLMGLTYTHSGLATSVIAIDKQLTKQALLPHGIPMPGGHVVDSESLFTADPLPRPYVLRAIMAIPLPATASARGRTSLSCWPNPIFAAANSPPPCWAAKRCW